jgi:serine protease Do
LAQIERTPNDKTDLKAKVIGTDPKTDLALLKVESSKDLPVAEWADSDQVEVGDWAIAIGSPFNLSQTVTLGIVSAKGRNSNVLGGADYVGDLIQTDAAINPGNSGGPLVTLDGQVMGVNTAIYTRSGGYMGIGFAIPSNLAKDVVAKLKKDGKIVRGWLGVYIQPLDPEMGKELGIKEGVSVHEVVPDSPAQKGGLKAGDVIVEVDGTAVKEVTQLQRSISGFKPGQNVKMKVVSYNDKKSRNLSVKIGDVPSEEEEAPVKVGQAQEALLLSR